METFTRDSDGAKFEFDCMTGGQVNIIIRPATQKLKTIDWQVVIDLGLLCEYSYNNVWGNAAAALGHLFQNKGFVSTHVTDIRPVEGYTYELNP